MTYAERDSIRGVIEGFFATGARRRGPRRRQQRRSPARARRWRRRRARLVHEPRQGYGHATRRGLLEASGDLLVLAEPDGTFLPADIAQAARLQRRVRRRVRHPHDARADLGRREHGLASCAGATGRWPSWSRSSSTPATSATSAAPTGCCAGRWPSTSRARMTVGGNHAGAEMMLLTITSGARFVEVPVNYLPRVGRLVGHRRRGSRPSGRAADDPAHPALPARRARGG